MKERLDFVSNSSSSSFVVYGARLREKDDITEEEKEDLYNRLDWKDQVKSCHGYDELVAGITPKEMKEDETLEQFKQRILDKLNKYYPEFNLTLKDIEYIEGVDVDGELNED